MQNIVPLKNQGPSFETSPRILGWMSEYGITEAEENADTLQLLVDLVNKHPKEMGYVIKSLCDKNILGVRIWWLYVNYFKLDFIRFYETVVLTEGPVLEKMIKWLNDMAIVYDVDQKAIGSGALKKDYSCLNFENPVRFTFKAEELADRPLILKRWNKKEVEKMSDFNNNNGKKHVKKLG